MQRSSCLRLGDTNIVVPKDADPKEFLPPQYHEFLDLFDRKIAILLPPHRPWDYAIELHPGQSPPVSRPYSMNQFELKELREYLDKELSKGFIRISRCCPCIVRQKTQR